MVNGIDYFSAQKDVVALRLDGVLMDLRTEFDEGDMANVEPVTLTSADGLHILRHSCAHVLAQAVQDIFEGVKLGIGPVIDNGFYYDFQTADNYAFTPDDFKALQKRMQKIVNEGQDFRRVEITEAEGKKRLANEPFKIELTEKKGEGDNTLTIYENVSRAGEVKWFDLCKGPHLPNTKYISNGFKLTKSSAAYWLGNDKNPSLQRIYGTAWASKDDLNAYLQALEEAERRDHRKLGTELDLFSFPDEIGSGLPVFHPDGGILRMVMENYSREKHLQQGYSFVNTPHITKGKLYEISQHLSWYKDGMFPPMHLDEEKDPVTGEITKQGVDYYLKPMNCPMHNLIYRSRTRSYKELPLRLFEFGTVYRYEKSGVVHGLTRVRGLTQDDAHIYCMKSQMLGELTSLLRFVLDLLKDYGLNDFYLELSTKDPEKFVGTDDVWEEATSVLSSVAEESGLELVLDEGGAAFYGPKISVQAKDAIGRTWQMSTIQLDFNLPQLFDLKYQSSDGVLEQPVMIHRALFGSIERFFGVLTEHYAGAFPAWLSPTQVTMIPVSDEFNGYLSLIANELRSQNVRVKIDDTDDRFAKKIRNASKSKVPFIIIAGQEDADNGAVSFRYRDGKQENGVKIADAIRKIVRKIESREND
ncbi:MAG: threonine--tRNA ligase [Bifidobacteriaceae bacterium]|jgi:threonyl-tRNA synthetase|nr:threonine--tRNA ligase [Bifidobacteriaceae bacterium]